MRSNVTVASTEIEEFELITRGKVRDVYRIDRERLLFVATDRISAFDCVMPNQIPDKGQVLTKISAFWFTKLGGIVGNHCISIEAKDLPVSVRDKPELLNRSMLVKSADVFPVECVVRGYLEGSGLKDYLSTGTVCGHKLPEGLRQCDKLPEPLFTPATKAASGHDENIDYEQFAEIIGDESAKRLRTLSLELYSTARDYALSKGIIIADTKFEFGVLEGGEIILIDEVLTPDSSRFWDGGLYKPGNAQASFDKQFVREYLESLDWDKTPPAPHLPEEIVSATRGRYLEAFERLTGSAL
jgi:phosphoribosylaminoimidazole-succinocarboxamide synthase